jgi:hypothetical protein
MKNLFALFLLPLACLASVTSQTDKTGPFLITGSPQTIPVGFPFQQASDLLVLDSGPTGAPHDPAVTLTLNSDYTVTGGGYNSANQMQTGSITVSTGGANNVQTNDYIVIMRAVPINQVTSFSATGPLTISLLEKAMDKQATLAQQVNELSSRSLQFENFEFGNPILSKAARANNLQGYDAAGNPFFYPLTYVPAGTIPGNDTQTIATLRALSVTSFVTGQAIRVLGYYASGDQAGTRIYIYNAASAATDTGGTVIAPNAGSGRWLLSYTGPLHTFWFGCYGDNTHADAAAFQAAVTASKNNILIIDPGVYLIGSTITLPASILITGTSMRGSGALGASLIATFAGPVLSFNPGVATFADIEMEHFQVTGNAGLYGSGDGILFGSNVSGGGFIHNIVVSAFGRYGVNISSTGGFYAKDVYSAQNTTANFYNNAEYATFDNCQADGSLYSIYVASGGDGARIKNCTLEGATTSVIYVVSGATSVCVEGCNLNLTAGGYGIETFANDTRIVNNKIFGNGTSSLGVLLGSSSSQNVVSSNFIAVDLIGLDDEGSGRNQITGSLISGGVTGCKINPSTYPDVVSGEVIAGATNSVLHVSGVCVYSGNWYDNGSGTYKPPTVSAGTAIGIQNAGLGSYSNGAGAATGTLTNAPAATNPTKWIPIDDGGTIRYFPAW